MLATLSGIAQSAHKAATDLRLLQSFKEIEEPFEEHQIGSSAMAYKRNPMRAERICGLARFVMSLESSAAATAATQWLERTLDDSANRRLTLPQAFLAVDAIAAALSERGRRAGRLSAGDCPATGGRAAVHGHRKLLMAAVAAGGDRQDLHERIRRHSQAAAAMVKQHGAANDLLERLQADPAFSPVDLASVLDPGQFVGRAPEQVDEFLAEVVAPIQARYAADLGAASEIRV